MQERTAARAAHLSLRQRDRLRYIAACGPVFRADDDEDLERLQLVRPFNGMPTVVEANLDAGQAESPVERVDVTAAALLSACRGALRQFSRADWCQQGYGCDDCDGCQRFHNLQRAVEGVEPSSTPSWYQPASSV
jgi:hypothetical protein